jgi:hypothetical protein
MRQQTIPGVPAADVGKTVQRFVKQHPRVPVVSITCTPEGDGTKWTIVIVFSE